MTDKRGTKAPDVTQHPSQDQPKVGDFWRNQRRGFEYRIISLPFWSDSDNEDSLDQWVVMRNVRTNIDYTRSMESFFGNNRLGAQRFVRVYPK